jgi:formiminotetrahydrofolate cyclodeaminase
MSASLWQAPLAEFQSEVSAAQPAPAGVAVACVTAALAVSLLIKVLRITGQRPDLLDPALRLMEELRAAADADVAAVRTYIQTRDKQAMQEVPRRGTKSVVLALNLSYQISEAVTGLIAADISTATALLHGANSGIQACLAANGEAFLVDSEETHFLNVDLDIRSASSLAPLVAALSKKVFVLSEGRHKRTYSARLELARQTKTADATIRAFCVLIRGLPPAHRRAWNSAKVREFSIGIRAGTNPRAFYDTLEATTVNGASELNARISVTVYPPDRPVAEA